MTATLDIVLDMERPVTINAWSRKLTVADLLGTLDSVGIPGAKNNELSDVWEEPQVVGDCRDEVLG